MLVSVTGITSALILTVTDALTEPAVAVRVAVPDVWLGMVVANPELFTFSSDGLLEDHVTWLLRTSVEPSVRVAEAVNC
jgi:hypothetical protein